MNSKYFSHAFRWRTFILAPLTFFSFMITHDNVMRKDNPSIPILHIRKNCTPYIQNHHLVGIWSFLAAVIGKLILAI